MMHLTQQEYTAIPFREETPERAENRGGRRNLPHGFTQEGVSMLSGVLNSERAVQVNILIMRAFIQLRHVSEAQLDLVRRFEEFEERFNDQLKKMVPIIRQPQNALSNQAILAVSTLPSFQGLESVRIERSEINNTNCFSYFAKASLHVSDKKMPKIFL